MGHDKRAVVLINGKEGVINNEGRWIVRPQAYSISDNGINNKIINIKKNGQWGFIDTENERVIEPQFDDVHGMSETGLIPVSKKNKWGLVDRKGEWILQPKFNTILFDKDLIFVKFGNFEGYTTMDGKYLTFTADELYNANSSQ